MRPVHPKKMLILDILEVLRRYSDENHPLTQRQIVDLLRRDYGMEAERKAVRRNLDDLIEAGYPVGYRTIERDSGGAGGSGIRTDYCYLHEFTDAELRLLIDGLVFSHHITLGQRKELIGKLEGLSSVHFKSRMRHVREMTPEATDNAQLFLNIELLDEAIDSHRKVRCKLLTYSSDKRGRPHGSDRTYVLSPYQMAAKGDRYYLICNDDRFSHVTHVRVDRMVDLEVLEEKARPFSTLRGSDGKKLNLAAYLREHVYMHDVSKVTTCEFLISKYMVPEVLETFGDGVTFFGETEETVKMRARMSVGDASQYAKSHVPSVLLLSPKRQAVMMYEDLCAGLEAYESRGIHGLNKEWQLVDGHPQRIQPSMPGAPAPPD